MPFFDPTSHGSQPGGQQGRQGTARYNRKHHQQKPTVGQRVMFFGQHFGTGFLMGAFVGSSIAVMSTLVASKDPARWKHLGKQASQIGVTFGTIFGVGSMMRAL
eukprot:TRINITY_DN76305_c0_g1_i1.p3 TRINITY_DN76305_c0_g1~~TRINITY_DN76305_c0_g1_i1.p3  ORF type:complete len:104 (+),score=34.94 TRINITY_DN76305_c0_g1_i1:67-378(+)